MSEFRRRGTAPAPGKLYLTPAGYGPFIDPGG